MKHIYSHIYKFCAVLVIGVIAGSIAYAQTTVNFAYTGAPQNWVVPAGVFSINIDARGAKGGGPNGGNGARVTATVAVTPGQTLQIFVGGQGGTPTAGWNGGGAGVNGGVASGGGGGASDIRVAPYALGNRIVVAGGGGGRSGGNPSSVAGGAGGCNIGSAGTSAFGIGGGGGTQVAGGGGGAGWIGGPFPGQGAAGTAGSLGQGGNGGPDNNFNSAPGGGGGGGYYGGGGGGSDNCCPGANGGGAGGGGSSLVPTGPCTISACNANFNNGQGSVSITYPGTPIAGAAANPTNTGPYCEGSSIIMTTGGGGIDYDWIGPGGYVASNVQNPVIPVSTVGMSGVYTVTVTLAGGCTGTGTTTVVVNPIPVPTANNTGPYCAGDVIQLNSPIGTATDDWVGPAGYVANNVLNPTIPGATVGMSGDYTVTVTAAGCSGTATTSVVVNALPIPTAGNTGPYCEEDVVDITSSGGVDYDWTGPAGFVLNNTQNATYPSAAMPMNGTYTVTVTDVNNCSATATTTMVVNLLPIAVANNDGPYCEGEPVNLTSGGGAMYGWNGPIGYVNATQNPTISPSVVANTGTYTVLVTTAYGCTRTATTDVLVTPLPIPIASNTGPYCEGGRVDLSVEGGNMYAWTGPQAFASSLQNPSIVNADPDNTGIYNVTVTDLMGCTSSTSTNVFVAPTPTAVPIFNPQNPSMLDPEINFSESSYANIVSYVWDIDGTGYNTSEFTHTFANPGDYPSYLVVTNNYGCFDTTFFNVHVDPQTSIYIPNSFTPNGDEMNEIFFVYGMGWARMEMIIFDRWGNEVFYTTDKTKGWNGNRQNGEEVLMEGTYAYKVYIIDIYGKEHNFMGHVNIIR